MPHTPHHVGQLIAVDVASLDQDPRRSQLEFGMEWPRVAGFFRLFTPSTGSDDIDPAIAVDIADSDTVSGSLGAEIVLGPDDGWLLLRQFKPCHHIHGIGQEVEFPISVDVGQLTRLGISGDIDLMLDPRLGRVAAGILDPADPPTKVAAGHNIGPPIAVHIERRVGKVLVVMRIRLGGWHLANLVPGPARSLIPRIAREDVDLPIPVEVRRPCCLVGGLVVNRMPFPAKFFGLLFSAKV